MFVMTYSKQTCEKNLSKSALKQPRAEKVDLVGMDTEKLLNDLSRSLNNIISFNCSKESICHQGVWSF